MTKNTLAIVISVLVAGLVVAAAICTRPQLAPPSNTIICGSTDASTTICADFQKFLERKY